METTEKIVEAYVRYIRGWATIPNIKCDGQYEIDLLAIDPISNRRYHIESGVSGSQSFSRLTSKPFDPNDLKIRVRIASTRRTLGYFVDRKFGRPEVVSKLAEYGFVAGDYGRVIVTWGWTDDAGRQAKDAGVELWDFRDIMAEIADAIEHQRTYFTDDTLRTINLFVRASGKASPTRSRESTDQVSADPDAPYWIYQNRIRKRARLHKAECRYCRNGRGHHGVRHEEVNAWVPFHSIKAAESHLRKLKYGDASHCFDCLRGAAS